MEKMLGKRFKMTLKRVKALKAYNVIGGEAILFNHFKFIGEEPREGTHQDTKSLKAELEGFGIEVKVCEDFTCLQIENKVKQAATKPRKKGEVLIVVIMTHGSPGGTLKAKDGDYKFKVLENILADSQDLDGIPKIFFIQACQGDKYLVTDENPDPEGSSGFLDYASKAQVRCGQPRVHKERQDVTISSGFPCGLVNNSGISVF
jgi:hypothetical protein